MDVLILIALSFWVVLILIAIFTKKQNNNNKEQKETNYLVFFVLGISLLSLGSIFIILSFTAEFPNAIRVSYLGMGIFYSIIGFTKRNTWKIS